jgi:hypothetical protein
MLTAPCEITFLRAIAVGRKIGLDYCSWLWFQMAKNQRYCVPLFSVCESIVFLGSIAIANVKQSGGPLAHTKQIRPPTCRMPFGKWPKIAISADLSIIRKGRIQGLRPGSVVSLQASDILARESQCRRCTLRCPSPKTLTRWKRRLLRESCHFPCKQRHSKICAANIAASKKVSALR